jgi:hypothetical protein
VILEVEIRLHRLVSRFVKAYSPIPPVARLLGWLRIPNGQFWDKWTLDLSMRQAWVMGKYLTDKNDWYLNEEKE